MQPNERRDQCYIHLHFWMNEIIIWCLCSLFWKKKKTKAISTSTMNINRKKIIQCIEYWANVVQHGAWILVDCSTTVHWVRLTFMNYLFFLFVCCVFLFVFSYTKCTFPIAFTNSFTFYSFFANLHFR